MAFNEKLNPNGEKGKRLTILSIDGGGVRGIIPARILEKLQVYLERVEDHLGKTGEHHLCDYFDMIAGTSSGGLITAMITTRTSERSRVPIFKATQVVEFFKQDAVKIFPETFKDDGPIGNVLEAVASVADPIYNPDNLNALLEEKFGEARLSEALTSVIIPAFDTENEVPVFFSSRKCDDSAKPLYDVKVKDACRATTAVPILFPAAEVIGFSGDGPKKFNVIDGGIAVNDPTLVAVTQAIAEKQQAIAEKQQAIGVDRREIANQQARLEEELRKIAKGRRAADLRDFRNVLVLSLGTGQHPMRFIAKRHWSSVEWLINPTGFPLLSSFLSASGDMVEYYTSMIFDAHQSGHHYLRIQTDRLSRSEFWEIDDATQGNLDTLCGTADALLTHPASKRNFATGKLEDIPDDLLDGWLRNGADGHSNSPQATLVREKAATLENYQSHQLPKQYTTNQRRLMGVFVFCAFSFLIRCRLRVVRFGKL
ncbi:unnamed protein product [Sphagnum troendelagicum]